jgi:predicted nucleic acid-binding protein
VRKFVVDTNLFIAADRSPAGGEALGRFYHHHLPATFMHAVVIQELLLGGTTADRRERLRRDLIRPFERVRRLVMPSMRAWIRSGEVVGEMVERGALSPGGFSSSFLNDVLLAASCREEGLTLVTANVTDFERIAEVEPFEFVAPWPAD